MKHLPLLFLISCLIIKSIFIVYAILHAGIGLAPDEAQYWTWAKQLDWGYYSKPPGIAWQIRLGVGLFGDTELGVRSLAILSGIFLSLTVYYLARCCKLQPTTACFAGLVMAFSPMGIFGSFLATTDGGFMVFWTLACAVIAKNLSENVDINFPLLGFFILCGALFKWPVYWLWLVVLLFLYVNKNKIKWQSLLMGLGISLLGLLPSLIWNISHDWATFRHVASTVHGGPKSQAIWKGNFFDFIGAQAALLSPILFILLLCAFVSLLRNRKFVPSSLYFCGFVSIVLLGGNTAMSIFQKMQGNWAVYAYPTGIVLLCWYACEKVRGKGWLIAGIALSVILSTGLLSIPSLQSNDTVYIPYKVSPFKHSVGWNSLPKALEESGYDKNVHFLFGDKYQTSSILSFYSSGQNRAYFFNLHGCRKNQFSYWPGMKEQQNGKTGFFVAIIQNSTSEQDVQNEIKHYKEALKPFFDEVESVEVAPLFYSNGSPVKQAIILKAKHYNGLEPADTCLY